MIQDSIRSSKPYKIILVGSQAVGKSSLLFRIIQSKFDEHYNSTIGVDFKTIIVSVGQKQIGLQIWDTAGQQKFKALTQTYYRGAHGCICVYDINDSQSLRKAEDYLRDAFEFKIKPDCSYLLANKSDLNEDKQLEERGRQIANKLDVNFLKVSAKTGFGMGEMLGNLAIKIDKAYANTFQHQSKNQINKRPIIRIDQSNNRGRCGC